MPEEMSYAKAGVDINATDAAKKEMAKSVDRGDLRVLNRFGAFASLLEGKFEGLKHPILAFKTEEPGSKQKLAFEQGRLPSIAYDLVNHLINDLMVIGAEPLYVQDCIVCGGFDASLVTALVKEMAAACTAQDCVLVGGETSVQPGVVADAAYVLTASAIGVVDKEKILDGSTIREGDVVLGVASNGLHTNGYTLVRKLLDRDAELKNRRIGGETFLDIIMRPHKCYYKAVRGLFGRPDLKGLAHITGGGIQDNLNRILPATLDAAVRVADLRVPEVFRVIQREGNVPDADMHRTFNMGVGLTAVCSPEAREEFIAHLAANDCEAYPIGRIVPGEGRVIPI
jgi:phosphoribosylformylglycinamidine cyclo-ligase